VFCHDSGLVGARLILDATSRQVRNMSEVLGLGPLVGYPYEAEDVTTPYGLLRILVVGSPASFQSAGECGANFGFVDGIQALSYDLRLALFVDHPTHKKEKKKKIAPLTIFFLIMPRLINV